MRAQKVKGNDVIIVLPHDFEHPSHCYYRLQDIKRQYFGLASKSLNIYRGKEFFENSCREE